MKKSIALATLAMVPLSTVSVHASNQEGIVTVSKLNVRSGPSTGNKVLFQVSKNDKVTIKDSKNGWYKIETKSGKEGWSSAEYIKKSSSNDNSDSKKYEQVNVSRLNMRSGPSTSYRVITVLEKGAKVEVISESKGWSKIKYGGRIGYVSSEYLSASSQEEKPEEEVTKEKVVNTSSLNVRSGPSTSNSILGKLSKGTKVEVISESKGWAKIKYQGKNAYVSSEYLSNVSEEKPEEEVTKEKVVNTSSLNVRSGPSTSSSILGKLSKGTKVEVISESKGWSKIKYQGKNAYVSSEYLSNVSEEKPEEETTEDKVVNTSSLNVRSGPSTSYSILGKLSRGTKVEVISESKGWSKIKYQGKNGYVSSEYLSDEGSSETPDPSGNIIYKKLNYSLNDHVNVQLERAEIGGNVIHSSRPRSSEVLTTHNMRMTRSYVQANRADLEYFLNPDNFINSTKGKMQFLRIDSYKGGVTASELNSYLNSLSPASNGTNVFYNQGQTFINAAKKYDVDLAYLVSHAMWETGYGKSTLAQGQTLTHYKGEKLPKPVKVYNFFGIGAIDHSANVSGAEAAYSNGWTSIEATIDGSAKWIASNYIHNSKYQQNNIYKMKFNYDYSWHQYATDVNWANGISGIMVKIVNMYDGSDNIVYEVPDYK